MEQPNATRTELLALRARLTLAVLGRDLLNEKRDQLMEQFRAVADTILAGTDLLDRTAAESRRALARAESRWGPEAVASAAMAGPSQISLEATVTSVMGVRIADISYEPPGRPLHGRGYSLSGTDPLIDAAADRFEAQLELILDHAADELRLRRLAEEIGKATRRVNALEFVVIPEVEQRRRLVEGILEERERQDHFRLKRVKARKGPRLPATAGS
jgi:V/A-type H+/Na+-transporting ATPase subunit D